LNTGALFVRRQLIKRELLDLKTDAAYRRVPLPRQTVQALEAHLRLRPDNPLDLVFPTEAGKPVEPSNFYARVWIPTRERAGLPHLRMHDCRHHVASVYLSQGRSIKYVQRLLGHAQASTLLNIYAWVTRDEEDVATAEFERWLGQETSHEYAARRAA
jgi:integrase